MTREFGCVPIVQITVPAGMISPLACRARVEEHFSWHAVAERMTALYQQSIDEFHTDERK